VPVTVTVTEPPTETDAVVKLTAPDPEAGLAPTEDHVTEDNPAGTGIATVAVPGPVPVFVTVAVYVTEEPATTEAGATVNVDVEKFGLAATVPSSTTRFDHVTSASSVYKPILPDVFAGGRVPAEQEPATPSSVKSMTRTPFLYTLMFVPTCRIWM
jgi:hypothetical protein